MIRHSYKHFLPWLIFHGPQLLWKTIKEYGEKSYGRMGAALAFYTLFSIAPMLYLLILVFSYFVGEEEIYNYIHDTVHQVIPDGNVNIKNLVESAKAARHSAGDSTIGYIVGLIMILYSVTAVFNSLKNSFNEILGSKKVTKNAVVYTIYNRLIAFVTFVIFGLVIMLFFFAQPIALGITNVLSNFGMFSISIYQELVQFLLGFLLNVILFMCLYGLLPDRKFPVEFVFYGGSFTALMFLLGQYGVIWYLGQISLFQEMGAIGAFIIILVWVFYSAQIIFFGACLMRSIFNARNEFNKRLKRRNTGGKIETDQQESVRKPK